MKGIENNQLLLGDEGVLAVAAHEIKSPLILINHLSNTLNDEEVILTSAERNEYLNRIQLTSDRVLRLTNQLILSYKLGSENQVKFDFKLEPINPGEICEGVIRELASLAKARNQTLRIRRNRRGTLALANRDILHDALMNLVENAIMHNPPGKKVYLGSTVIGDEVRIKISDNGIGVTNAEIKNLSSYLGRAQPLSGRPGSGLGLFIVDKFAKSMGGSFSVGRASKGSSFFINLMRSHQLSLF